MKEKIGQRFMELIDRGKQLLAHVPRDQHGTAYWVADSQIAECQAWISSTANLLRMVSPRDSHYFEECRRLEGHKLMTDGVPSSFVKRMFGLLSSASEEWGSGMLTRIEYLVLAATFDDFLDHAAEYHKANKKIEASVLASAVLEDTVKKIAVKNSVDEKRSIDPIIDGLTAAGVFTPVKAKRVKAYAAIRNKALHAEWDAFDIKDVGEMIKGVRELIEQFL